MDLSIGDVNSQRGGGRGASVQRKFKIMPNINTELYNVHAESPNSLHRNDTHEKLARTFIAHICTYKI